MRSRRTLFLSAALLAGLFAPSATAGFKASAVQKNRVINTSVGYHGFSVAIPAMYHFVPESAKAPGQLEKVALANAAMLGSFGRSAGVNVRESLAFSGSDSAVAVGTFILAEYIPTRKGYTRVYTERLSGLLAMDGARIVKREMLTVAEAPAFCVVFSFEDNGTALSEIIVGIPLQPRTLVMIAGITPEPNRETLHKTLLEIAKTFQDDGRKAAKG